VQAYALRTGHVRRGPRVNAPHGRRLKRRQFELTLGGLPHTSDIRRMLAMATGKRGSGGFGTPIGI